MAQLISTDGLLRNMSFISDGGIIVKAFPILHWASQSFVGHSEAYLVDWATANAIELVRNDIIVTGNEFNIITDKSGNNL